MVRELPSLIIIHSGGQGISWDKLGETLWYDKSALSARNNRAVYIGKLRALLETVGSCELSNDTGYWKFTSDDIFVDYLEYASMDWSVEADRGQIERLLSLTMAGNLLPDTDYRWLDKYKGEVADLVIDKLWQCSRKEDAGHMPEFLIAVADAIFRFDQLNEHALYLKCRAYYVSGRHSSAKHAYDLFCTEYKEVYGKNFPYSFTELIEKEE